MKKMYERAYIKGTECIKVAPYNHEYQVYAKERWIGKSLIDVFRREFRERPVEYYEGRILSGDIMVNGDAVEPNYVIRNSDLITHKTHKHEPAISAAPIEILHCDADVIVVDKPYSIPVHPTGRYSRCSLSEILKNRFELKHMSLVNRIDIVVSGVVIMALNPKSATQLHQDMISGQFVKEYVCIVKGQFPEGETICEAPLGALDAAKGIHGVSEAGKPSKTAFKKLNEFNGLSLVYCRPFTGRSHQIRVHLSHLGSQYSILCLGFPILNDRLYGRDSEVSNNDTQKETSFCAECNMEISEDYSNLAPLYLHAFRYTHKGCSIYESSPPKWPEFKKLIQTTEELPSFWFDK